MLHLADSLALSARQRGAAERLRAQMLTDAVPLGAQLVAAERGLDALFAIGRATADEVERQTTWVAALGGRLRAVHLWAHVGMREALTGAQVTAYDRLRAGP